MERPSTSKPRGVCRFFRSERGCREDTNCRFLHDHPTLTPFDLNKTCKFYAAGFCTHGSSCWFRHTLPGDAEPAAASTSAASEESEEADEACSICYEKPMTFGLLTGCNHMFCLKCLRDWRTPNGKSADLVSSQSIKKCPVCREPSRYIVPSSIFYAHGTYEKAKAIDRYRESMSKVPCRYFKPTSRPPHCPFADDCFYQHHNLDGTPYMFGYGVDDNRRRARVRQAREGIDLITFEEYLRRSDFIDLVAPSEEVEPLHEDPLEDLRATVERIRADFPNLATGLAPDHERPSPREIQVLTDRILSSLRRFAASRLEDDEGDDDDGDNDTIHPSDSASQPDERSEHGATVTSTSITTPSRRSEELPSTSSGAPRLGVRSNDIVTHVGTAPTAHSGRFRTTVAGRASHANLNADSSDSEQPMVEFHMPDLLSRGRVATTARPSAFSTTIDQFAGMPPLEPLSNDDDETPSVRADGALSSAMSDEALLNEASRTVEEADELTQRAAAVLQDGSANAGTPSSPHVTGDAEQQSGEETCPITDGELVLAPSEAALAMPDPTTGSTSRALDWVEDDWEAQQVPIPPFKTDGRGKVVFANPEAANEYSESRRRRHGRM